MVHKEKSTNHSHQLTSISFSCDLQNKATTLKLLYLHFFFSLKFCQVPYKILTLLRNREKETLGASEVWSVVLYEYKPVCLVFMLPGMAENENSDFVE